MVLKAPAQFQTRYFTYRNVITFVAQHTLTKQISYRVTSEFQQLDIGHFPVSYTLIQTKLFDFYTLSQSRLPENHILHNSAYPYSLCMVVPQGSIRVDINQVLAQLDCALCYPVSEQKKFRYEIRKVAWKLVQLTTTLSCRCFVCLLILLDSAGLRQVPYTLGYKRFFSLFHYLISERFDQH